MINYGIWLKNLGFAIGCVIALSANSAMAQNIIQDETLPTNSLVKPQGNTTIIEGGTQKESNLFHSFTQFSVLENSKVEFNNSGDIKNIISRVTGKSVSNIDGILKVNGTANLFLINPNGIIFGPNASLQINGSFLASTASSLNFADDTKFSAIDPQVTPLLTVSVPIGLQFGATAAPIRNQSQASSLNGTTNLFKQAVGLQVKPGETLALVGGDIFLEGGNLTAKSGRIELGSVASNSLVNLIPINQGWMLGYEGVQNFQNIKLNQRNTNGSEIPSIIDASGEGGGNIQVQGRQVLLSGGSGIWTITLGSRLGGNLAVTSSESVELVNPFTALRTGTFNVGQAGELTITTGKLIVQDGAQVGTSTIGEGAGGNLTVNAFKSVDITGGSTDASVGALFSATGAAGKAGDVTINTGTLSIKNGAMVSTESSGLVRRSQFILATGKAGNLNVTARSILLDNKGTLTSETKSGQGGNIKLEVQDLLLLRRNSQISTNAGTAETGGDGGNLTINAANGYIVAVPSENSDITANAYTGSGGRVDILITDIFGIERRKFDTPQSDITASSRFGVNGTVQINSSNVDPSKGLVELPVNLVDASRKILAICNTRGKRERNSFTVTGRGGKVFSPTEPLIADAILADWITLKPETENRANSIQNRAVIQEQKNTENAPRQVNPVNQPPQIVEANGWTIDANGNMVLVAQAIEVTPHSSLLTSAPCAVQQK